MADAATPGSGARLVSVLTPSSTPDRLRLAAVLTVIAVLAAGSVAWILTDQLVRETDQVANSTGEVLIATQQVSASFAEADASAVSVHLAGAEGNREQRRLFEQAVDRATASLERIARLVGEDERSHAALEAIAADTTRYVGLVEAARLASSEELAQADTLLTEATEVNRDEISPAVRVIGDRARDRFDDQTSSGWYSVAIILLIVAVVVLLGAQVMLARRFRRLLNLPVLGAMMVMLALVVVGGSAFVRQQRSFNDAEQEAFDAIVVSEQIQQTAYRHRALATASVLTGADRGPELDSLAAALIDDGALLERGRLEAGSARELATADELTVRWFRYQEQSSRIQDALRGGDVALAEGIAEGPASATFNGFNTAVEAALLDNREQFLSQLDEAAGALGWLRGVILVGSLIAAILAWWGFSQRIGEYR